MLLLNLFVYLVFAVLLVHGKAELKWSNCNADEPSLIKLVKLTDTSHARGPIRSDSVLHFQYETKRETKQRDPVDIDVHVTIKKFIFFNYFDVTTFIGSFADHLPKRDDIVFKGDGVFRLKCPFKRFTRQCLPPKGLTTFDFPISNYIGQVKSNMLASGWYKVKVSAFNVTPPKEKLFCMDFEIHVSV